jgi:carboxyl-terminal processing protease
VTAILLVAIGAAAIFWAGLSLGGGMLGRNDEERRAIEAFAQTYRAIADDYIGTPVPKEVLEGALDGMVEVLGDPYSRYMPPEAFDAALDDARGEFEGIGAVMDVADDDGEPCAVIAEACRLTVEQVLRGAPAEAAGLLAGDVVTRVDDITLEGLTIDDSVWLIRGPKGTEVTLAIERSGDPLHIPITRDTVVSDDVHGLALADGEVGYISVDSFSTNAATDFADELRALLDDGVRKLVIDVRDDPGGFVEATVDISSQFIPAGPIYWEEDADGKQNAVLTKSGGAAVDEGIEVAVLVNGGSASASEIFGGALQDAGRARLVGEPTFGKGTVQEWNELPGDNGGVRLSVAKWLTRDKHWVEGVGLIPDVPVSADGTRFWAGAVDADPAADPQLQAAIDVLLGKPVPSALPVVTTSPAPSPDTAPGGAPDPSE